MMADRDEAQVVYRLRGPEAAIRLLLDEHVRPQYGDTLQRFFDEVEVLRVPTPRVNVSEGRTDVEIGRKLARALRRYDLPVETWGATRKVQRDGGEDHIVLQIRYYVT